MNYLFFDTETTGLVAWKAETDASCQPYVVEFSALLCDDSRDTLQEFTFIVKPDNYVIPVEASDVNGISTELAMSIGVPIDFVIQAFFRLVNKADLVIAHNFAFDAKIVQIHCDRNQVRNSLFPKKSFCTMLAAKPHCRLPGRYGDFKWPKLEEALPICLGRELVGAHAANADVVGCRDLYFWLKEQEQ